MAVITLLASGSHRRTQIDDRSGRAWDKGLQARRKLMPWTVRVPNITRDIRVKIASTRAEWEEALQLVADSYQARGYEVAGAGDYRFTSYHALPDTVTIVAKEQERVVATFSLVPDNTLLGLPMESIYKHEIQQLRQAGRHLFETGSLADRDLSVREFIQVFLTLMQVGWQHQVGNGADTTVITVNPRHRSFYTKVLGFAPLGPWRSHPTVQGHPAEAYFIDPKLMQVKVPKIHQHMFGHPLPAPVLSAPSMPAHLVRYFGAHSSQTDPRFVEEILRYVKDCGSPRRW